MNNKLTRNIMISVSLLMCTGIVMVYSSTVLMSMEKHGSGFRYLLNHIFTIAVGAAAMLVLARIDYQGLRKHLFRARGFEVTVVHMLLAFSLLLLVFVFVPGIGISANGARRWLKLWPSTFQPSEFVKLVMVIFLSDYMARNIDRMNDLKYGIAIPVGVMIVFQAIIILQPDFGAVMSLAILTVGLLILGGMRLRYIWCMLLLALPVLYMLANSASYRAKRITCFMDPWKDSLGCGFQLIQSFIAFGNGGVTGLGLGGSKQKLFFLPEVHTDFIFSLIGEELGFIGVLVVLALFAWFIMNGVRIAHNTRDPFSYFLATGLTIMIGVQVLINFAVTTGLMPTKGLPLPFISYGGSALLINMSAVGMLINISNNNGRWAAVSGAQNEHVPAQTAVSVSRRRRRRSW